MDHVKGADASMKRRTVVKGAAWAAPVVTMGVAAPIAAATPPPVIPTLDPNGFCKHPGNPKRYHIGISWENTLTCDTTVTVTNITVTPTSGQVVTFPALGSFTVSAGTTTTQVYDSNLTTNSANGTVNVQYTYTDCSTPPVTVTEAAALTAPDLPPCQQLGVPDYPHTDDD